MDLETLLQTHFGLPGFRPGQREIVTTLVAGHDALAVLPTGGGKSLCFQSAGLALGGTTMVVSPLIALMIDQVEHLLAKGIRAACLHSGLSSGQQQSVLCNWEAGQLDFVYLAPERLTQTQILQLAVRQPPRLIAVDEAHCVSQWGHDFRPAYLGIRTFVDQLPVRPVVAAFTGTATQTTRTDIIRQLGLHQPVLFLHSFSRNNLALKVVKCASYTTQERWLLRLLREFSPEPCLVYCLTRVAAVSWHRFLMEFGPLVGLTNVGLYHGGMAATERQATQTAFVTGSTQVLVATSAFGMGVDKPDIRLVIHLQPPLSMEEYYQEVGRAGRDGQPASCYFLWCPATLDGAVQLAGPRHRLQLKHLVGMLQSNRCRQQAILAFFGEKNRETCGRCDVCAGVLPIDQAETEQFKQWQTIRQQLARQTHQPETHLLPTETLRWLVLLKSPLQPPIPGLGPGWFANYGEKLSLLLAGTGITLHPQTRVCGSTRECQWPRSPPTA